MRATIALYLQEFMACKQLRFADQLKFNFDLHKGSFFVDLPDSFLSFEPLIAKNQSWRKFIPVFRSMTISS